eukprot:403364537
MEDRSSSIELDLSNLSERSSQKQKTGLQNGHHSRNKTYLQKMQTRLIVMSAEILQNNIINEYVFCCFLLFEHLAMIQEPLRKVLLKIDSDNKIMNFYKQEVLQRSVAINVGLNLALAIIAVVFVALFWSVHYNQENNQWYKKIGFKVMSLMISLFSTALAIPYLMSNFSYISCTAIHNTEQCLQGDDLLTFFMNIVILIIFEAINYYFLVFMDLNFNIPIENYNAPWTTLRHQTILITQVIYIGSALSYVFDNNTAVVILMQVSVLLGLIARNFFKFRNSYYLLYKVNFVDTYLNSFLIIFNFLSILITQINLTYSFNTLYLLFLISILFATSLSYVHSFHRASSLERFFLNFQQLEEDIDFSTNTVIDYLQSKNKKDAVRIKGLIQLIINESGCDAAKKRQRDKIQKYTKYIMNEEIKQVKKEREFLQRNDDREVDSQFLTQSQILNPSKSNTKFRTMHTNINIPRNLSKFSQSPIKNERNLTPDFTAAILDPDSSQIGNTDQIDVSQINLIPQKKRSFNKQSGVFDEQNTQFNSEIAVHQIQRQSTDQITHSNSIIKKSAYFYDNALHDESVRDMSMMQTYNQDYLSEESELEDQEQDLLLNSLCDFHNYQDVNLIIEVIEYFLIQLKDSSVKVDNLQLKQIRLMLLKIRLIYLAHKFDKLHYLMFLISKLETSVATFQLKTIKYIFQKRFHQIFQNKLVEKKDKITPTTLVMYEHHREVFENRISDATENMIRLLHDLRLQETSAKEIQKRFARAKYVITITLDLEKRFKSITELNAQQIELVAMYFHFLDQVVHMENEARHVLKIMIDMSHSDKINKRFESLDTSKSKGTGFILVSGNMFEIGRILKINNSICNYLQYFKDDLYSKKIGQLMPDCIAAYHDLIIGNYIQLQNIQTQKAPKKKNNEELKEDSARKRQVKKEKLYKQQNQWHLTKKNSILMFKTKQGLMSPLICNFDIYFDLNYGIQFLCLAEQGAWFQIDEQKVLRKSVYIVQTSNRGIIEACSSNFVKRYGLSSNKILDERIDIQLLNDLLYQFNDKAEYLDTTGMPVLLNFNHLRILQSEESKFQMEKYQLKLISMGKKIQRQISGNKSNPYDNSEESINNLTQTLLSPNNSNYQINLGDLQHQVVFVKREIIYQKQNSSQSQNQNYMDIQQSQAYNTNVFPTVSLGQTQGKYQASSVNSFAKKDGGIYDNLNSYSIKKGRFDQGSMSGFQNQQNKIDKIQGIYYYLVFQDGMTTQMKEQSVQYIEQLNKQNLENARNNRLAQEALGGVKFEEISQNDFKGNVTFNLYNLTSNFNFKSENLLKLVDNGAQQNQSKMGNSDEGVSEQTKSEDQFTFASTTSSSTSSTAKDKITELKNESFLGQVPIFVNLFRKVFFLQFILFVVVGTVILMTAQQLYFRAFLNVANGVEPNYTSLVTDRFSYIHWKLEESNVRLQDNITKLRLYVKKSANKLIQEQFSGPKVLIYELSEMSTITNRTISVDEVIQLLIVKTQMFTEGANLTSMAAASKQLQCDCAFTSTDILIRSLYNRQQSSAGKPMKRWNQNEREAFWFIENTNKYITKEVDKLVELFLQQSSTEVEKYKDQILILSVSCASLALLCSIAFIPYYLRTRRNLNTNIYLIEKMSFTSIDEIASNISLFYKQLSKSRGKYGGNQSDMKRLVDSQNHHRKQKMSKYQQNHPDKKPRDGKSQNIEKNGNLSTFSGKDKGKQKDKSQIQMNDAFTNDKDMKSRKVQLKKYSMNMANKERHDSYQTSQENERDKNDTNNKYNVKISRPKNSQFTHNTYKTTENMNGFGSVSANEMNEEMKYRERVVGAKEDITMRFQSDDSDNENTNKFASKNAKYNLAQKQLNMSRFKDPKGRHEEKKHEDEDSSHDKSESNEDSDDDNHKKSRKHKHSRNEKDTDKKSDQEQEENQVDMKFREIIKEKRRSLSVLYFKQKMQIVTLAILFAMILSMFFILDYILMANTFNESILSIKKFQVFYEQEPCFLTALQLSREQFLKNETGFFVYGDFTQIGDIFSECMEINKELRQIKQNYPATLSNAISFLNQIDSDAYCSKIVTQIEYPVPTNECLTDNEGIFKNGYSYGLSTMINYFYMIQITYESKSPEQRTAQYLSGELKNQKSVDYTMIYYKYMDYTNNLIKETITKSFVDYFNIKINQFTAVYAVFIVVLVLSIIFLQVFILKNIQKEIYLARKTIQLIPHKELTLQENYDLASKIKY